MISDNKDSVEEKLREIDTEREMERERERKND